MYKQSLLESIISEIKAKINQIALNRMTENAYLDPEKVLQGMKEYGDETLGNYATRTFFNL